MSDPSSTSTESTGPSKKKVSPGRNAVGLVVLLVLIVIIGFQYPAFFRFNAAVKAIEARISDDDKGFLQVPEAESMLGKPDGPGIDMEDGGQRFTKKTYTWHGPLKSYAMTVFYRTGAVPYLHHFETDGTKFVREPVVTAPGGDIPTVARTPRKRTGKRKAPAPAAGPSKDATATNRDAGKAIAPTPPAAAPSNTATDAGPAPTRPAEPTVEPSKDAATPASARANANASTPAAEPPKDATNPAPTSKPK